MEGSWRKQVNKLLLVGATTPGIKTWESVVSPFEIDPNVDNPTGTGAQNVIRNHDEERLKRGDAGPVRMRRAGPAVNHLSASFIVRTSTALSPVDR